MITKEAWDHWTAAMKAGRKTLSLRGKDSVTWDDVFSSKPLAEVQGVVAYSFQHHFVTPIEIGLGLQPRNPELGSHEPKTHTIRAIGKRRHARVGDKLQLYCGLRSRAAFKIGDAICTDVSPIVLHLMPGHDKVIIGPAGAQSRVYIKLEDLAAFARADGFATWSDLAEFWDIHHKGVTRFAGLMIEWRPVQ